MRKLYLLGLLVPQLIFAQFTDNFGDGEYIANPVWSGDTAGFTIVNVFGNDQLRSNSTTASSNFYLSTPSALVNNCQWELWVNLAFNTSSTNYVDVYLTSDSANLKAANNNGYFVRIGNTADEISLYKKVAGVSTKIIDGTDGVTNSSNNILKIKVIRDSTNLWKLEQDATGTGNNYVSEGNVTDSDVLSSSFFGIHITQSTASFFQKHYFDDFYAGAIIGDTSTPAINSVNATSNTMLDVVFSEVVEKSSSENVLNYSVNNSIGNPLSAVRDATDSSIVRLSFTNAFQNGITNTLTITNISDLNGNILTSASRDFLFFIPDTAVARDIIINEIFPDPDPAVGLPNAEFVEIFNRSNKTFDLSGWKFSDGTTTVTLGSFSLVSGDYLILCSTANVGLFSGFGNTIGVGSLPSLNNASDNLFLSDNNDVLIDRLSYSDSWYRDAVKKNGGWTLERIDPDFPCESSDNWIASLDTSGGTPGKLNSVDGVVTDNTPPAISQLTILSPDTIVLSFSESVDSASAVLVANYVVDNGIGSPVSASLTGLEVKLGFSASLDTGTIYHLTVSGITDCAGNVISDSHTFAIPQQPETKDVIINELFPDPDPSVGLPAFEFIELYNRSQKTFDLSSWVISDPTSMATFSSNIFLPGEYIIVCSAANASAFSPFGKVVTVGSLPSLNNTSDTITLKDNNGNVIDIVTYSDAWYRDAVKKNGGWTLERVDPDFPCESDDNWAASTDLSGGTPGKINSVDGVVNDTTLPRVTSIAVLSNNSLSLTFSESLDNATAETTGNYSVDNGLGVPSSVSFTGTTATLFFTATFDSNVTYHLIVSGISDCIGNVMLPDTLLFALPSPASKFDVLITEIFPAPDPQVSLPAVEFVELFNSSDKAISLKDWTYSDASSSVSLPSFLLLPGNYLILCAASNATIYSAYGTVLGLSSFPSLNNDADELTLRNSFGNIIFYLNYSDSWYRDAVKKNGGWTMEMIDTDNPCSGASNWRASNDVKGGTPGQVNSVNGPNPDETAPSLNYVLVQDNLTAIAVFDETLDNSAQNKNYYVIDNGITVDFATFANAGSNEILLSFTPPLQHNIIYTLTVNDASDCSGNVIGVANTAQFGLAETPDSFDLAINEILSNPVSGGSDFIELYNHSQKIIDLKDVLIASIDEESGDTSATEISTSGFQLLPGNYVALTGESQNITIQYFTPNAKSVIDVTGMPSFDDDEDIVVLFNKLDNNSVIDAVHYYDDWNFALIDDLDGVSLERINYNSASQDKNNWHSAASTVGYATPAYQNSQFGESGTATSEISINPKTFSPNNDGYQDILNIHYQLNQPGYVATIKIYDDEGRVIRELTNNWLLDAEGNIVWDGVDDNGVKARIGVYVLIVELFDLSGDKKKFKESCVLAGKI